MGGGEKGGGGSWRSDLKGWMVLGGGGGGVNPNNKGMLCPSGSRL